MSEALKAAIYGRVSTEHQDYALQVEELRAYTARQGWQPREYLEKESAKAGSNRPVLTQLLKDARLKKFEAVVVWKIDRFGRSLLEFIQNVQTLDGLGIRFIAAEQGIDTDKRNPLSKLLMNILGSFAEFELDMIHERTEGGLKSYMRDYAAGKVGRIRHSKSKLDLPVGRPRHIFRRDQAQRMRAEGMSYRKIGAMLQVPFNTVRKALLEAA